MVEKNNQKKWRVVEKSSFKPHVCGHHYKLKSDQIRFYP
jgi:hypothetical protein